MQVAPTFKIFNKDDMGGGGNPESRTSHQEASYEFQNLGIRASFAYQIFALSKPCVR